MSGQAEHIEMKPDVMGNHVNVTGIAVMEVVVDNDGVSNAYRLSLATPWQSRT